MPELTEEEVRRLTTLNHAVNTLWANPEARKLIQQAQKVVDPKAKTPDLDAEAQLLAPVKSLEKKFDEFIEKTAAEKAEDARNKRIHDLEAKQDAGFSKLRKQKYTDDGIAAIKKLMDEKGILDPLDAAAIFEKAHPPQTPVTPGGTGGSWNFAEIPADGEAFVKKLLETKGNNDLVAEKEAWNTINEVRGVSRR